MVPRGSVRQTCWHRQRVNCVGEGSNLSFWLTKVIFWKLTDSRTRILKWQGSNTVRIFQKFGQIVQELIKLKFLLDLGEILGAPRPRNSAAHECHWHDTGLALNTGGST